MRKYTLLITLSILLFSQISYSKENFIGVDAGFVIPINIFFQNNNSGNWHAIPTGPSINYQYKKTEFNLGVNMFDNGYSNGHIAYMPKFGIKYHFKTTRKLSNFYIEQHTFIDKWAWVIGGPTVRYNYQFKNKSVYEELTRYRKINFEASIGYEWFTARYFSLLISAGVAYTFEKSIEEKWNQQPKTFYNTYFYFPFRFGIKFHIFNVTKKTHEPTEQNNGD